MKKLRLLFFTLLVTLTSTAQNRDPLKTEIVTTDLENFWLAFETAKPDFNAKTFQQLYINRGTKGLKSFVDSKIKSAENLSNVISTHSQYYSSIKSSTDSINGMKNQIRSSLVKLKELYPDAVFPPVYFVIGRLSSGGTTSKAGLLIGAEMYGRTPQTPMHELDDWQKMVLKPVGEIPYIVAHELIHFQQHYDGGNLLAACLKEGVADFIGELISGKQINQHVHDFANPREKELWLEFKERMLKKDYTGWLYSTTEGRPQDLGYWMGYQIAKSYYDHSPDKLKAIDDMMHIRDAERFLELSQYPKKFE